MIEFTNEAISYDLFFVGRFLIADSISCFKSVRFFIFFLSQFYVICVIVSFFFFWADRLYNLMLINIINIIIIFITLLAINIINNGASQVVLVVKNMPTNAGCLRDAGLIPRSVRSPGGGHGHPLQDSCLENPMDRGARGAMVHRIAKSWTQLKQLSMHIFIKIS